MFHLSDRELYLLGEATRKQTAEIVGWMVLANLLGKTVVDDIDCYEQLPTMQFCRWVGSLNKLTSYRGDKVRKARRQDVVPDSRRVVRARYDKNQLTTGK